MKLTPFAISWMRLPAVWGGIGALAVAAGVLATTIPSPAVAQRPQNTVLQRVSEPREKAFSLLVPEGWRLVGGTVRGQPSSPVVPGGPTGATPSGPGGAGGAAAPAGAKPTGGLSAVVQTVRTSEATFDLTAERDTAGTVMFRRLPDASYCDAGRLPEGAGAGLKPGDIWHGLSVKPLLSAREYIKTVLIPRCRPEARELRVEDERDLPDLAQAQQSRLAALILPINSTCNAAVVTVTYDESGTTYRERFFDLIVDRGPTVGSMWLSRGAVAFRAPAAEFESWETIFALMLSSVKEEADWLATQTRSSLQHGGAAEKMSLKLDDVNRQQLDLHAQTMIETRDALFPAAMAHLEPFANPFTGAIEAGTLVLGKYRWESGAGDVVYSANETFNPAVGWTLGRSDWQKCKVQPRGSR
jgi:hypothetical protein